MFIAPDIYHCQTNNSIDAATFLVSLPICHNIGPSCGKKQRNILVIFSVVCIECSNVTVFHKNTSTRHGYLRQTYIFEYHRLLSLFNYARYMEILLFNRQVPSFEYVTLSTLESVSESMSRKPGKIYLSRVRSLRTVLYTFQSGKYRNPETHTTLLSSRKRHTFVKVRVVRDVRVVSFDCPTSPWDRCTVKHVEQGSWYFA